MDALPVINSPALDAARREAHLEQQLLTEEVQRLELEVLCLLTDIASREEAVATRTVGAHLRIFAANRAAPPPTRYATRYSTV